MCFVNSFSQKFNVGIKAGLNLPSFKFEPEGSSNLYARLHVGIVTNFELSKKLDIGLEFLYSEEGESSIQSDSFSYKYSVYEIDYYKEIDVGIGVGLSYEFIKNLEISANYTYGVVDIHENQWVSESNRLIQISLGYYFL